MATHINYNNVKRFININSNVDTIVTNCTSIAIENKGELAVFLTVEDTTIQLKPGESLIHSNDPDVLEMTVYTNITFADGEGEKLVFVTKEFITPAENDQDA